MVIKHLGHSCFRIRGAKGTIITDPFDEKVVGFKLPRTTSDIVTISHQHEDHNCADKIGGKEKPGGGRHASLRGKPFMIDGPGEYEVKGIRIHGISSFHDNQKGAQRGKNVMYLFHLDGISLLHCGDLGHTLTEEYIDIVEEVDILLIPVGGVYTINAQAAAQIAAKLEPRIVIPMHYNEKRLNQEVFAQLQKVDAFLSEIGQEEVKPIDKLVVSRSNLPEETKVVVLSH